MDKASDCGTQSKERRWTAIS